MRLQSSLGDMIARDRKDLNMNGYLMVGKVIKVHHKWHTADVKIVDTGDVISGSKATEGKFSCRILERYAGYDEELQVSYGEITPIQKDAFVLIGFLRNLKSQPIILGSFHSLDHALNLLPTEYPILSDNAKYERLIVSRTQDYKYYNGNGEFELSHHSKSFITSSEKPLDDSRVGFGIDDLRVKDRNGKTLGLRKEHFKPLDILAVIRDKFDDATSGFLKLFISGQRGMFRISKDTPNNQLTFIELSEDRSFRIKQQLDSSTKDNASNFSQIRVSGSGEIEINRTNGDAITKLIINESGDIAIETPQGITVSSDNINITSNKTVSVTAPVIRTVIKNQEVE